MDLADIIQTSLEGSYTSNTTTTSQSIIPQSSSETIIIRGDQRFTLPSSSCTSGSTTTISIPSSNSNKEQSIVLPANFNTSGGPLLCQLDDNSYILIDGLDHLSTATTTIESSVTPSPPKPTTSTITITSPKKISMNMSSPPLSSVTVKPSSTISPLEHIITSPTLHTSPVVRQLTPPQSNSTVKPQTVVQSTTSQGNPRSTYLIMSNTPFNSKLDSSLQTKSHIVNNQSLQPVRQNTNTSTNLSLHALTSVINSTSNQGTNSTVKYILVPQAKNTSKQTPSRQSNIISNAGMKTITFNPSGSTTTSINLPIGTSLIPTPKTTAKPHLTVLPSSKINLVVPPSESLKMKPQTAEIGASELAPEGVDDISMHSDNSDLAVIDPPKSPTLFDMTVEDIGEKTIPKANTPTYTYSRVSSISTPKITQNVEFTAKIPPKATATTTITHVTTKPPSATVSQVKNPSVVSLPLQYIVPGKVGNPLLLSSNATTKPTPQPQPQPKPSVPVPVNSRKKAIPTAKISKPSDTKDGSVAADTTIARDVVASRNIQPTDKLIINTAIHEMKKLFARRELVLKQLNTSCAAMGKVEYKLSISGTPVNVQEMYERITNFQKQYETDLKHLDWSISAMHKLHSEMSPRDSMRSTEDILQDLIGPVDGEIVDPKAKYEKFNKSPVKKLSIFKPKSRSPKKQTKTIFYQGEEDCPDLPLTDRKSPIEADPSDGKWHCSMCSKIFLKQISLAKHLEFDHPVSLELEKKLSSPRSPKLPHACQDCDRSFHSRIMLTIHRSEEHNDMETYELSRESKRAKCDPPQTIEEEAVSEDEYVPPKSNPRNRKRKPAPKKPAPGRTRATKGRGRKKPELRAYQDKSDPDFFDPDIPLECTHENPIIILKPISAEVIAALS